MNFPHEKSEKTHLLTNSSRDWAYEGIAYYAFTSASRSAVANTSRKEMSDGLAERTVTTAEPPSHDLNSSLDVSGTASIQSVTTLAFGDIVFPLSYLGGNVAAYVYDSVVGAWQCVLPATNSPTSLVLGNIQPDRSYTLEVFAGDPADGELVSVHRSSFEMQLDAPASIHEAVASQAVSDGVGSPVVRLATPAVDGTLSIKLYSSSQGVVKTLTDVLSEETVELPISEGNRWYWISGWRDSDNALVMSIWMRHETDE